jgi:anti-sigma factor RsiW
VPEPGIRCSQFVESVTDWMEGVLSADVREAFEQHLLICAGCTEYLEELRTTLDVLRGALAVSHEAPPPAARDALLEAFRRRSPR